MRTRVASAICFLLGACLCVAAGGQQVYSSRAPQKTAELSLNERVDLYMVRRNYPQAIALLEYAIQNHQGSAEVYNRLGIAEQQVGQLGAAEKAYKKAIKLDKTSARYRNNLGTVYYMRRKWNDAAKQFQAAIQMDPTQATYFVNLGGVLFVRKKYEPALAAFRSALRLNPDALFPQSGSGPVVQDVSGANTARFHYDLSRLFCSMGMVEDALHEFSQAFDMHYDKLKESLKDPEFAPLRVRPEYRTMMGLPPLPPTVPKSGGGARQEPRTVASCQALRILRVQPVAAAHTARRWAGAAGADRCGGRCASSG